VEQFILLLELFLPLPYSFYLLQTSRLQVLLWFKIEHNLMNRRRHEFPNDFEIFLRLSAGAKSLDDNPLHFGQEANDTPRMQSCPIILSSRTRNRIVVGMGWYHGLCLQL
jgi:hypothetical protein